MDGPLSTNGDLELGCRAGRPVEASQALARRATQLSAEFSSADGPAGLQEVVHGSLIGSVSAMQESLEDLLTFSRGDRLGKPTTSAIGLVEGLAAPDRA